MAAALGLCAARRGRRTIVCEVGGGHRLARALGIPRVGDDLAEVQAAPGLFAVSIDPDRALEEYLRLQLGSRRVADLLAHNRLFELLAHATPGLRELATVGKAWELAQPERRVPGQPPYDLVIVDAPATGHGLALLRTPRTFRDAVRMGPIHRQADKIHRFLTDGAATAVVCVALPEEMPVAEALELGEALRREMGMAIELIVVNALLPERFGPEEAQRIAVERRDGGPPAVRAALRAAAFEHARAGAQRTELRRLREGAQRSLGAPPLVCLPFLFEPALERPALEHLSRELEAPA